MSGRRSCGNCSNWTRVKSRLGDNRGGLCEPKDVPTNPDEGTKCKDFIGKRYNRNQRRQEDQTNGK